MSVFQHFVEKRLPDHGEMEIKFVRVFGNERFALKDFGGTKREVMLVEELLYFVGGECVGLGNEIVIVETDFRSNVVHEAFQVSVDVEAVFAVANFVEESRRQLSSVEVVALEEGAVSGNETDVGDVEKPEAALPDNAIRELLLVVGRRALAPNSGEGRPCRVEGQRYVESVDAGSVDEGGNDGVYFFSRWQDDLSLCAH